MQRLGALANEVGGRGFKHDRDRLQASVTLSLQTICIVRISLDNLVQIF